MTSTNRLPAEIERMLQSTYSSAGMAGTAVDRAKELGYDAQFRFKPGSGSRGGYGGFVIELM